MVFYSSQADDDLDDILTGLLNWKKVILTREFCLNHIADILNVCDNLDSKFYHFNAVYEVHKRYGRKVHKYSRNKNTSWYIIYNMDYFGNVYINKIISNHLTFK